MSDQTFYDTLESTALNGDKVSMDDCHKILRDPSINLLSLLNAAYTVRKKYHQNKVHIHIINNAQNGSCPEDCNYCAQGKDSKSDIAKYKLKSEDEIIEEAKIAYENGAFRYCMVSSGRGPKKKRIENMAGTIRKIKEKYPIELCLSTGFIDDDMAKELKDAGLDRLNHNLNTSEKHYPKICTTHTYQDRINTLMAARNANLDVCSGMIVGMGETDEDIINVARKLRELNAPSIPVNFLIPIEGTTLTTFSKLSPEFCLRVLCLFRFLNPKAELRVAAGRELHLRSMEVMTLYPANSLFLEGYLNTKGAEAQRVFQMIKDAGFDIDSTKELEELIAKHDETPSENRHQNDIVMKTQEDLHPVYNLS